MIFPLFLRHSSDDFTNSLFPLPLLETRKTSSFTRNPSLLPPQTSSLTEVKSCSYVPEELPGVTGFFIAVCVNI